MMDEYYRVPLSTGEATATIAALRVVCTLLQQSGVVSDIAHKLLESAAARIEAEIPDFLAVSAEKLRPALTQSLARANFDDANSDTTNTSLHIARSRRLLETAWRTSGVAEIEYFVARRNEYTTRRVSITNVYETEAGWYVAGECSLRRDHRLFRLEHIRAVRVAPAHRPADDPFDPFDEEGSAESIGT